MNIKCAKERKKNATFLKETVEVKERKLSFLEKKLALEERKVKALEELAKK
jgi:hypothetical protein